ncbi:uncharacterized protein LOC123555586 [Mercenaria mercenaria]|uniref:uncharacterized protein LOC123555586 n=1 Tax=Mercenaria mercenaria TaxID=6596 RepID=UPI001E1D2658|nr:uncharacterized protein LOC123555586 [Mercenaria mercenaria]
MSYHMAARILICGILSMQTILTLSQDPSYSLDEFNKHLNRDFHDMDQDKNGTVELVEMENRIQRQDYNKDGCVSFNEFMKLRVDDSLKFVWVVFNHFDHNNDGCLEIQDQIDEFHEIDVNPKDGAVTIPELDAYYDKLFQKILPSLLHP